MITPNLQYAIYFAAVTLGIFFYGLYVVFFFLDLIKGFLGIKDEWEKYIVFVILVLAISFSTDFLVQKLIEWKDSGMLIVIILYIATYKRYEDELRRRR